MFNLKVLDWTGLQVTRLLIITAIYNTVKVTTILNGERVEASLLKSWSSPVTLLFLDLWRFVWHPRMWSTLEKLAWDAELKLYSFVLGRLFCRYLLGPFHVRCHLIQMSLCSLTSCLLYLRSRGTKVMCYYWDEMWFFCVLYFFSTVFLKLHEPEFSNICSWSIGPFITRKWPS